MRKKVIPIFFKNEDSDKLIEKILSLEVERVQHGIECLKEYQEDINEKYKNTLKEVMCEMKDLIS